MTDIPERHHDRETHTVRPRWAWVALVLMVAGVVVLGVGIIVPSWAWAAIGIVVLLCGGVAGFYGGFFYDIQGSPTAQAKDVVEGNELEVPGPSTVRSEAEVKEDVHRRWLHRR